MRLIDADELRTKMCHAKDIAKQDGELMVIGAGYLFGAPTIDAVPVVRCDDCCHRYENEEGVYVCNILLDAPCGDDDFCSYGEKMDGDEQ